MPRPCISTRSPWRVVSGAMRSSSQAVALRMKSAVRSAEPSAATPAASAASVSTAGGATSLVTTKQAAPAVATAATVSRARRGSSVARYDTSLLPSTWTRSGWSWGR